jgi:hypothetical protein
MFSTSQKMSRLQIALEDAKTWSKPFSLETSDCTVDLIESFKDANKEKPKRNYVVKNFSKAINSMAKLIRNRKGESNNKKRKYEFAARTIAGTGVFHHSKIILITPRYTIRNETDQTILFTQYDGSPNAVYDDSAIKIKPMEWQYFHWPDSKKPPYVIMARLDPTLKTPTWSGRFKIESVDEFSVKLYKEKTKTSKNYADDFYFAKVIISIDVTTTIIRILPEDPEQPPYKIFNNTKYDISFRQKPSADKNESKFTDPEFYKLEPDKYASFTWDDFLVNKQLEVEVEGKVVSFKIDDMGYHKPIELIKSEGFYNEKGDSLLKKGYLKRKKPYDDDYTEEYCVLSIPRQRLKIYSSEPGDKVVIDLKGAKVEDQKDRDFVLNIENGKKSELFSFRAKNENDARKWIEFIKKAAYIGNPNNMIHMKVDPVRSTKVVTFYLAKNEQVEEKDAGILDE